jgi:hypothetical protein
MQNWRDGQLRYLVHFSDGGSGMRLNDEPLEAGVRYRVDLPSRDRAHARGRFKLGSPTRSPGGSWSIHHRGFATRAWVEAEGSEVVARAARALRRDHLTLAGGDRRSGSQAGRVTTRPPANPTVPQDRGYSAISALALAVEAAEGRALSSPTVTPGLTPQCAHSSAPPCRRNRRSFICMPPFVVTKVSTPAARAR